MIYYNKYGKTDETSKKENINMKLGMDVSVSLMGIQ